MGRKESNQTKSKSYIVYFYLFILIFCLLRLSADNLCNQFFTLIRPDKIWPDLDQNCSTPCFKKSADYKKCKIIQHTKSIHVLLNMSISSFVYTACPKNLWDFQGWIQTYFLKASFNINSMDSRPGLTYSYLVWDVLMCVCVCLCA